MSETTRNRPQIEAGRELARGSFWMIAMRWVIRGIGFLSTIILARLLTPDDFGVVAMAMVGVAILEVFTQTGSDLALLRTAEPTREHYDAAWTLEILQAIALAALLYTTAPLVGGHFEDPRVTNVIRLLSLRALIGGFQNVGVVNFRRELRFGREFQFGIVKKTATFVVTVIAAFVLRSYWALVIGQVVGRAVEVGVSYVMSDYRPRLSLRKVGDLWGFSRWLILARFSRLLNRQFDRWVVGSLAGAHAMGYYYVASDFASSPSDEVVLPMSRAAFPIYSRLRGEPQALVDAFTRVLSSMTSISFVMGLGMAAVAHDFVWVVLGAKWMDAVPLIPWLGIFGASYGVAFSLDAYMLATGRERLTALLTLVNAILMAPVLWAAGHRFGIEGVAAAKAAMAIVFVLTLVVGSTRQSPLTPGAVWRCVWPPLAACSFMLAGVKGVQAAWHAPAPWIGLLRDVAIGAIVYIAATLSIWWLRGRPDGVERDALQRARRALRPSRRLAR
jgi:O-antigen/teichoic acid export membrane protein